MFRTFLVHVILIPLLLAPAVAEEAWQVTEKAWDAFAAEDWDAVETLANRAARTWGAKAKEINNTLIAFPSAEKAKKFANLNDLATITYLKGEAFARKVIPMVLLLPTTPCLPTTPLGNVGIKRAGGGSPRQLQRTRWRNYRPRPKSIFIWTLLQ